MKIHCEEAGKRRRKRNNMTEGTTDKQKYEKRKYSGEMKGKDSGLYISCGPILYMYISYVYVCIHYILL